MVLWLYMGKVSLTNFKSHLTLRKNKLHIGCMVTLIGLGGLHIYRRLRSLL